MITPTPAQPQTIPFGSSPIAPVPNSSGPFVTPTPNADGSAGSPQTIPFGSAPIAPIPTPPPGSSYFGNLGFDYNQISNPSADHSFMGALKGTGKMISDLFDGVPEAGVKQFMQGVSETEQGVNDPNTGEGLQTIARGASSELAGGINTVFSPISGTISALSGAPVIKQLVDATKNYIIDPSVNAISNLKPLQDFMMNNPNAEEVASNLITIGLTAAGMKNAPDIQESITPNSETESPNSEEPPVSPPNLPSIGSQILNKIRATISPTDQDVINNRVDALQQIEDNNKPVRNISQDATSRGIDVKKIVANTDLLQGSVDDTGTIDTKSPGMALSQFNDFMNQYESATSDALKREGISIPIDEVNNSLDATVKNSRLAGASKTRLINLVEQEKEGLAHDVDENGNISLSKLQDAKISTTNGIDYTKPETKINAKTIAKVYRTTIENNSHLPVADINGELSKYYKIEDYLESLNGRKIAGGRLGKYFAQTVGAVAGSHFGPLGSIIGAELAGLIKGKIMSSTFGDLVGGNLEGSDMIKDIVAQNKTPPIGLPAPKAGSPTVSNNIPIQLSAPSSIEPPAQIIRRII